MPVPEARESIETMSLNDLIFAGRNRLYGAYFLRTIYSRHINRSLIIALSTFTLLVLTPILWEKWMPESEIETEEINLVDPKMIEPPPIDPKTPPPPPLPSAPPPPKITSIRFVPPEVVPDEEVVEDPPKQEELKTAVAASETVQGDPNADPNELSLDESGQGTVIGAPPVEEEEAFLVVDQMPEFPEGDIQVYFSKHLKYPAKALKNEISGKVHISFIVMPDGSITEAQVMKGLGYGLDEEALRVVNQMPKWNPGRQAGRAVKVKINLPIKFSF